MGSASSPEKRRVRGPEPHTTSPCLPSITMAPQPVCRARTRHAATARTHQRSCASCEGAPTPQKAQLAKIGVLQCLPSSTQLLQVCHLHLFSSPCPCLLPPLQQLPSGQVRWRRFQTLATSVAKMGTLLLTAWPRPCTRPCAGLALQATILSSRLFSAPWQKRRVLPRARGAANVVEVSASSQIPRRAEGMNHTSHRLTQTPTTQTLRHTPKGVTPSPHPWVMAWRRINKIKQQKILQDKKPREQRWWTQLLPPKQQHHTIRSRGGETQLPLTCAMRSQKGLQTKPLFFKTNQQKETILNKEEKAPVLPHPSVHIHTTSCSPSQVCLSSLPLSSTRSCGGQPVFVPPETHNPMTSYKQKQLFFYKTRASDDEWW